MVAVTYTAKRKIHADHVVTELVTNGGMSSATGWTLGAGWAISGGLLTHTPGNIEPASQNPTLVVGYDYVTIYTVTGRTVGGVTISVGGDSDTAKTTNETFSYLATATTNGFTITPTTDFDGSLSLFSVKLTSQWSMDIPISQRNMNPVVHKFEHHSMDNVTTQIDYYGEEERYTFTTIWKSWNATISEYYQEFFASTHGGETYTIDIRGTIASPDNPVSCITIGTPRWSEREVDEHQITWEVKLLA